MAKNKTSWKPGQSGNKKGGPKKEYSLTHILRSNLDKKALMEKLVELADKGDIRALQMIYERIEGKVKDKLEIEPVKIVFQNKSKKGD